MRTLFVALGCCVLGSFVLAACHSTPPPKSPTTASPLGERDFLLQSNEGAALLEGAKVRLNFRAAELGFGADCNHMGGKYTVAEGRLIMDGVFSTEMGCDGPRHAQDEWLQAFMTSRPTFALAGDTLTLANDNARLVFLDRVVADPDRPLVATVWEVNSYIDGDTAMGLMGIEGPRIVFAADGTWQARSVCLDASGRYTVEGDRLQLSGTRATQGECVDNDKAAAEHVRSVMADGELRYDIRAFTLDLETSGPRAMSANAVSAP